MRRFPKYGKNNEVVFWHNNKMLTGIITGIFNVNGNFTYDILTRTTNRNVILQDISEEYIYS